MVNSGYSKWVFLILISCLCSPAWGQGSPPDVLGILTDAINAPEMTILAQDFEAGGSMYVWYIGPPPAPQPTVLFSGVTTEQASSGTHSYKIQVSFPAGSTGCMYFCLATQIPVWADVKMKMYVKPTFPAGTWFYHGMNWGDIEANIGGNVLQGSKTGMQGAWEIWEATSHNGGGVGQYIAGPAVMFTLPQNCPATTVTYYVDNITLTGHLQTNWPTIWSQVYQYYTVTVEQQTRDNATRRLSDMDSWKADCETLYSQLVAPSGPAILTTQYQSLRSQIRSDLDSVPSMLNAIRAALANQGTPFNVNLLNPPERVLMLDKHYLDLAGAYAGYAQQYSGSDFITFTTDLTQSYPILPTGPTAQNDETSYYGWGGPTGGLENPQVLPDTSPVPAKPGRSLSGFGCRGTFVPFSMAVRAGVDLPALTFTINNLTCGSNTIPSSAVDLRVVGPWYRPFGYTPRLTNELLLHDPDFAVGVSATQTNLYKDAMYGNDATALQPLTISANKNRQFYVTIKIPDNATAGTYQGQITGTTSNGKSMIFSVALEVLPFDLEPTPNAYSFYYPSYLVTDAAKLTDGINSWYKNAAQMEAELRGMADHGVNTLNLYDGTPVKTNGVWDFSALNARLDIAKRSGLTRSPFTWLGAGLQFIPGGSLPLWSDVYNAIRDQVRAVNTFCQTNGYPRPAWYGSDEASGDALVQLCRGYGYVNLFGGLVTVACYQNYYAEAGDNISLPVVFNGASNLMGQRSIQASQAHGHECWIYNCPATSNAASPSVYRRRYGLALWRNGENGAAPWSYCGMPQTISTGQGYNGLVYNQPIYAVAYPTWSGKPIDTIIYEGWREGIYDTRYLATLQKYLARAKAAGVQTALTAEVDSWLANLSVNDDLTAVRRQMADYTEALTFNLSGTVVLGDFGGDNTTVPVTVELRGASTTSRSVSLDASGHFTLPAVASDNYTVRIKASHWLAKLQTGIVVAGSDATIPTAFNLINGDSDGDNGVTGADLSILLTAMDTQSGDPLFDARADLDGDTLVTSTDLSISLGHMDETGDL